MWGIAAVLLIAVWMRSYFSTDQLTRQDSSSGFIAITLGDGRLLLGKSNDPDLGMFFGPGWSSRSCQWSKSGSIPFFPASVPQEHRGNIFGWPNFSDDAFIARTRGPKYSQLILPFWLLVLPVIALAVVPWLRWRFRLRTLLITTTLVAVALGLVVWAAK
jgi:hypothetical protein